MNDSVIVSKQTNPRRSEMSKVKDVLPKLFNFYGKGASWGIQAAAVMALFLFALELAGADDSIALKFLKYFFMAGFLGSALSQYKEYLKKDTIFKNGILYGIYITLVTAATLVAINLVAFLVGGDFSFNSFGGEYTDFQSFFVVSGAMFFEVFVFGMIITFICLQYFKSTSKYVTESE